MQKNALKNKRMGSECNKLQINQLSFQFQIISKNKSLISSLTNLILSPKSVAGVIIVGTRQQGKTTIIKQIAQQQSKHILVKGKELLQCDIDKKLQNIIQNAKNMRKKLGNKNTNITVFIDDMDAILVNKNTSQESLFAFKEMLDKLIEFNIFLVGTSNTKLNKKSSLPDITSRLSALHVEYII
ncbi:MAG: AAA family ATPase [Alphaproteobacteria bacterium]|nr:AAA family ATPase [Rickettsiales bacterium]